MATQIMAIEMNLKFSGKRVLINGIYYPLNFVVFESKNYLGLYDPKLYQISLNKQLMFEVSDDILRNVLRHELAHFMVAVQYQYTEQDHGVEFRNIFKAYNWDLSFSKSQIDLSKSLKRDENEKRLLEKIEKLLKLGQSSNQHEASLATKKANDLMLKHNLENLGADDEVSYVKRVMEYKRRNTKHDAIYEILKEFQVYPVFNQGHGGGYLEIIGSKPNILIADYLCQYLDHSIDMVWLEAKRENPKLKGQVAKNSFMRSFASTVAQGLRKESPQSGPQVSTKDLISIKNDLQLRVQRVYPKLRQSYSKGKTDSAASSAGSAKGKKFKISKGLQNKGSSSKFLSGINKSKLQPQIF